MRIVSLIASATEITCSLGQRAALVGRSHECDSPESVTSLPALTKTKLDKGLPSRAIDTAVKSLVGDGLAVYQVDEAQLRALAPDVILTQDQCEVCAASLKDVEAAVCEWVGRPVNIVSLHPNCLADIWNDIRAVGEALESPDRAAAAVSSAQAHINSVSNKAKTHRPKVLCVEWVDPLMSAGHWIPELITAAGGESLLAENGGPSPYISMGQIEIADPDIIVVAPCGFDVERSTREMAALNNDLAWRELRAVREGRIAIADGNLYFNRPSLSVVETVGILEDIFACFENTNTRGQYLGRSVWRPWAPTKSVAPV
jgi:iron complex transport system substrate-binding protein